MQTKKMIFAFAVSLCIIFQSNFCESSSFEDLNNNGTIGPSDFELLLQVKSGLSQCPAGKICDWNGDGTISNSEVNNFRDLVNKIMAIYDMNSDGFIGIADVQHITDVAGTVKTCPVGKECDINLDGSVNVQDAVVFTGLRQEWKKYYDLSGDERVDIVDMRALSAIVLNKASCPNIKWCDVNNDGDVTVADIVTLANYVAKESTPRTTQGLLIYDLDNNGTVGLNDAAIEADIGSGKKICPPGKHCDWNGDGCVSPAEVSAFKDLVNRFKSIYDIDSNGFVGTSDVHYLIKVNVNKESCPSGKLCDVNLNSDLNVPDVADLITLVNLIASNKNFYDLNNSPTNVVGDIMILMKVIMGTTACPPNKVCDINGDNQVNVADAIAFDRYINQPKL